MKLFNWLKSRKKPTTLRIFMRSGNSFTLDRVMEYSIRNQGNDIIRLAITQHPSAKSKLLINTIALNQIEGVIAEGSL